MMSVRGCIQQDPVGSCRGHTSQKEVRSGAEDCLIEIEGWIKVEQSQPFSERTRHQSQILWSSLLKVIT